MKLYLHRFLLPVIFLSVSPTFGKSIPIDLLPERANHLSITEIANGYHFVTTGNDPHIAASIRTPEAVEPDQHVLAFEYFCPSGVGFLEVFFAENFLFKDEEGSVINGGRTAQR